MTSTLLNDLDTASAALGRVSADVAEFRSLDEASLLELNRRWADANRILGATGALITAGCYDAFSQIYEKPTSETVTEYLAFSDKNPSSIKRCLENARFKRYKLSGGKARRNQPACPYQCHFQQCTAWGALLP